MKHTTEMSLERYLELVVEVQTSFTLWAKKKKKAPSLNSCANDYHILLAKTAAGLSLANVKNM